MLSNESFLHKQHINDVETLYKRHVNTTSNMTRTSGDRNQGRTDLSSSEVISHFGVNGTVYL